MDIFIVILLLVTLNYFITRIVTRFNVSENYVWTLFGIHFLLTITYMISAAYSASDSVAYYKKAIDSETWLDLFGTSTTFITFLGWIFIKGLGLSYYAVMLVFSFFGYLAALLFYITIKENISLQPVWQGMAYTEIVFLLPNLHYWSSSLGKGSVIMLGLALFIYGLSRFNRRFIPLLLGGFLTYMVRPHMFLTMILSIMLGVFLASSGIKWYVRWMMFLIAAVVFYFISDSVVEFAETESLNILNSDNLSHRVEELGKAGSGVDIQNYNLFMKMFTFWFRPLFFDGFSAISLIASFENLFYLFMVTVIIRESFNSWGKWNGWFKICFFFFLFGSFILAQVSGNLGIAMRQKAQVMPFFFIIFCKAMSYRSVITDYIDTHGRKMLTSR